MLPFDLHKSTPNSNKYHKFDTRLCKIPFSCPSFRTLRESSTIVYKKPFKIKKTMAVASTKTRIIEGDKNCMKSTVVSTFDEKGLIDKGGVSFHETATHELHSLVNHLSKWVVAVSFSAFIMLMRHDGVGLWGAMGCVSNFILSITLKQILKQERPLSEVSSGPGMPSSHAQSIFFTHVFIILSVVERVGLNGVTTVLGVLFVALGLYFSWLRVSLRYHTSNQVSVGTIVGSIFSVLWFWSWKAFIHEAYLSNLWVQIVLIVGVACYYLGFISYFGWHLVNKLIFL